MWPLTDEKTKGLRASDRCIGAMAGGYSMARIKRVGTYSEPTKDLALVHVEAILARGNYAAMSNVGGLFVVKEMVMA